MQIILYVLSNIITNTLNSQKRIEKEITLLNFRDIDPNRIIAIVKRKPDLLLASKENVEIFMLATITRSNAKKCSKEKEHHSHVATTSKENVKFKVVSSSNIYAYMIAIIIQCINTVY